MKRCVYCGKPATTMDAVGLDACQEHASEADEYFEQRTGRKPTDDTFLYCEKHCDMWEPGCTRCEECCQYHYGHDVSRLLKRIKSGELGIKFYTLDTRQRDSSA